jgi:GT2 family glycosyltransferase
VRAAGPRVSVVLLPGGDADASLRSLGAQSLGAWELIECGAERGVADEVNDALSRATGDYIAFLDRGDLLHPEALGCAVERGRDETVDIVYTDEDHIGPDGSAEPFFKPDWSPERLLGQNYVGRLALFRHRLLDEVGGARTDAGEAWEYDLVLRATDAADRIEHVTKPCYRRCSNGAPPSPSQSEATRHALDRHLARRGLAATAEPDPDRPTFRIRPQLVDTPLVSIVIPAGGGLRRIDGATVDLVSNCVESIVHQSTYENYEIVTVLDDAVGPATRTRLEEAAGDRLQIVPYHEPFNFSRKINLGVLHADGEIVVLLNDDTAVLDPDWLEAMLVFAQDPPVGAVGAILRFADRRYQHTGVLIINGDPGHPYYGFPPDFTGYRDNLRVPANYLAVTAACLMMRRSVFMEVGGLSTSFPANYNDVDLCLKVRRAGYRVVCTPEAQLFHYESSSRGAGAVAKDEMERLHNRWASDLRRDPYYSPHFLPSANFQVPVVPTDQTIGGNDDPATRASWWWPA